MDNPSKQ